jgi:NADPH-dependent ferric siderophore reductase
VPDGSDPQPVDVRGSSLEQSALLARLPGTSSFDLEVRETLALTPSMRRLRCHAAGLGELAYEPGQDMMVAVPVGNAHFRRRYTIRHLERPTEIVDLDIVVHGDGPGARWAQSATPGVRAEGLGPRGKITLSPEAQWHLFCGDEAGLPGFFAMIEALPPGQEAIALIEVDGPADELSPDVGSDVNLSLRWLHRGDAEPGTATLLGPAVEELTLPAGRGHAYLAGELAVVAALRGHLATRMDPDDLSPKAYWRRGVSNAAHGEPTRD